MTVENIARTEVVTVTPDASVRDIVDRMKGEQVGSVVVVDDGRPVGIVTDRDLVMNVLGEGVDPAAVTAADFVVDDLVTVEADAGVYELFRTMADNSVRRIPVVRDGDLAGIVTMDDLVVLLGMEMGSLANLVRAESPSFETAATELPGW